jgi:hypothetical protein
MELNKPPPAILTRIWTGGSLGPLTSSGLYKEWEMRYRLLALAAAVAAWVVATAEIWPR